MFYGRGTLRLHVLVILEVHATVRSAIYIVVHAALCSMRCSQQVKDLNSAHTTVPSQ